MKISLKTILTAAFIAAVLSPIRSSANPGDLYASDNTSIRKISPNGSQTVVAAVSRARGLAFDAAGNLFVGIGSDSTVAKFTPTGVQSTFAVVGGFPAGLAFDSAGNLYVAEAASAVDLITPDGTTNTFFKEGVCGATDERQFYGVAVDSADNVYVADGAVGVIYKFDPCGTRSSFASLASPVGLAFDRHGNLFVSTALQGGAIVKITPNGTQSTFVTGIGGPMFDLRGLAFDTQGNLFVADRANGAIYKIAVNRKVSTFAAGLNFAQYLAIEPAHP